MLGGSKVDIKPIRTEQDYTEALAQIEELWEAADNTPEGDLLDVLCDLVAVYEERNHSIDPPDPIEAILFRMEQQGLTRAELEPYMGGRSHVSEVLNGKRPLSRQMISNLHYGLGIPFESLMPPPDNEQVQYG